MNEIQPVSYAEFIWLLTKAQSYHIEQEEPIPGINEEGVGKIKYCLDAPFMGVYDQEFHPTFDKKAAILFYDLCKLHCLLNGNKRMAVETTIYFAFKNKRYCFIHKDVLKDLALKVVESNADNKDDIVWWLERVFYGGIRKFKFRTKVYISFMFFTFLIKTAFKVSWNVVMKNEKLNN